MKDKLPKVERVGGTSGSSNIMGGQGNSTNVPFSSGPDKAPGSSSAPYHYQPRPTGNTPFAKGVAPRRKK